MEKTLHLEVAVKVDDKEDCYCGRDCRFKNGEWCELFEEAVRVDTHRMDYSPFDGRDKYFRCDNCVEETEKVDRLGKAIAKLADQGETLLATIRALDLEHTNGKK